MQFENDGILLWHGTSDAPAPDGTAIEGSEIPITIGVQPPDASNVVEISYRINEGSTETIVAKFLRNEPIERVQYFRAYLPAFQAGDRVEYNVICQCAGRQVPARSEEEQWASSFQVVAAITAPDEISPPTPELLNVEQLQESELAQPEKSQPEEILTNSNINNNNISESLSPTVVAEAAEPIKASKIKISDARLTSFYDRNPDFDILKFNLLNGQTNNLDWENIERKETLNLLKKYQRLLRINPNPAIAKKLIDRQSQPATSIQSDSPALSSAQQKQSPSSNSQQQPAIDSAHAIASMTEEQFVKMMPGDETTARQMHKKAIDIKAKSGRR